MSKKDISALLNYQRTGIRRLIGYLHRNGTPYKGQPFTVLQAEFERLTGLKKPEGIKLRIWAGQLYRDGSPFLPPNPKSRFISKKTHQKPKKKKKDKEVYYQYLNSPEWKAFRELALNHHGRECRKCGTKTDLHVHHRHYKNIFHEKLEDVMILCEPCHMKVHGIKK